MPPTMHLASFVQRSKRSLWQDLGGESVLLDLEAGVYYGLNGVGSRAWSLMESRVRVGALRDRLAGEYDVEPERCARELLEWLDAMACAGLVEVWN